MPQPNQPITSTNSKTATYVYTAERMAGIPLKLQAGVESITNRRIVSIQQSSTGEMFAVAGFKAFPEDVYTNMVVIGFGVLEEALQSGGIASIAPDPNNFVDGDIVTVLNKMGDIYQVDYDPDNIPDNGISFITITQLEVRVDLQGRLTSVAADADHFQLNGAVFTSVPGPQMKNQLIDGAKFFKPTAQGSF